MNSNKRLRINVPDGSIFKPINEFTTQDCIASMNSRHVYLAKYPFSGFKDIVNQEMILIKDRIKEIKKGDIQVNVG